MRVTDLDLPGLKLIEPDVYADARGWFVETWHGARYRQAGIADDFVQDNLSHSVRGALRGLHLQRRHGQAKLITVTAGEIFDVAVDLRAGAATFGHWHGVELSAGNHRQLYVPEGFAHGFLVLSATADVAYRCSGIYRADDETGVLWSDPDLAIDWPLDGIGAPLVSDKDAALPRFAAWRRGG